MSKGFEREELVKLIADEPLVIRSLASEATLMAVRRHAYLQELLYWIVGLGFVIFVGVLL